nr:protein ENHANCED DISEASE RESISTANCE 2 [Arachis hypogaea]
MINSITISGQSKCKCAIRVEIGEIHKEQKDGHIQLQHIIFYNKKEKYHRITMAAFNIQEAFIWKEKIEYIICRHQGAQPSNGNKYIYFEYKSGMDNGKTASSSDRESQFSAPEDEDEPHPNLLRRTTIGNGPPESIF